MNQFTIHGFRRKFFRNLNEPKQHEGRHIDCLIWDVDTDLQEWPGAVYNEFPRISVPEHEFEEIISELPAFDDLPIAGLAWNEINKPCKFVIECFDIDEKIMIDTSGYAYPRYKAAVTESCK
jgi:hypothetical protein